MTGDVARAMMDALLDRYTAYYDVKRCSEGDLVARAEFHSRGEKYLLTRGVNLWSVEDHEYVFFFEGTSLDAEGLESARRLSIEEGTLRIKPSSEHRSSLITTVLIYDSIDTCCIEDIKSMKHHRDFGFMLKGWMDYRVAALETSSGRTSSNRAGRDVVRNLEALSRKGGSS